jgi:hypothetical protein
MLEELKRPFREQGQGGYVLLLVLITSITLFIALSGILSLSLANLSGAKRTMFDTGALYTAESGVDNAVHQLTSTNGAYTGTTSCPVTGTSGATQTFNDTVKGKGTYQTCVTAGTIAHEYIVYSVGKVYKTSTASSPVATRKLKVVVQGNPVGAYAVQTGPGGLIMSNSATVSQGPVYVGGFLTMNNSAVIGSTASPIAVSVANARCPVGGGATFPVICNTGTSPNPITINSNQNHIYGSVSANDQTNSYATQITNPGLVATSGVTAPALPGYDRVAQAAAATTNWTSGQASCSGNGTTVTWPANVKITGDVTMKNSCTVIVSGNAWITGSFDMSNSAVIQVGSAVATQPTIMVDGVNGVKTQQTATVATNASQIGMEFITFYSTDSCTTATTAGTYCDDLTAAGKGVALYNSQAIQTVNIGNQGAASGSVFYAKYTMATIGQAGSIGALLGQTINLAQSGNLVFTSTVVTGNYAYSVSYYEFQ